MRFALYGSHLDLDDTRDLVSVIFGHQWRACERSDGVPYWVMRQGYDKPDNWEQPDNWEPGWKVTIRPNIDHAEEGRSLLDRLRHPRSTFAPLEPDHRDFRTLLYVSGYDPASQPFLEPALVSMAELTRLRVSDVS